MRSFPAIPQSLIGSETALNSKVDAGVNPVTSDLLLSSSEFAVLLKHNLENTIPATGDLFSDSELETYLSCLNEPHLSFLAGGDLMLGGRARSTLALHGSAYPFAGVLPLLSRSAIVMANLEGPLALKAAKVDRTYSYKVHPRLATSLATAGINVLTLANNHLLDCGPAGVMETLAALEASGIDPLGAGPNQQAAHTPLVRQVGPWKIGLLGYYWNKRCGAGKDTAGCALDTLQTLQADIKALKKLVDRVIVTFHWGVPYERLPAEETRRKAKFAVECGADVVIGHHPHIIQPFEIYRGCPIFYSVGNFIFGSNNSRAEGMLVGLHFEPHETVFNLYALYVKNRDPRVNQQPKVMRGKAAGEVFDRLKKGSGESGGLLKIENGRAVFRLPYPGGPLPKEIKGEIF